MLDSKQCEAFLRLPKQVALNMQVKDFVSHPLL